MADLLRDAAFWEALPGLIWPVVACVLVWKLWPVLKGIFESRKFAIKLGGFELSAQEASEQLQKAVTDLQTRLAEMETRLAEAEGPPTGAAGAASGRATAPAAPSMPRAEDVPAFRILWVDDRPQNNASEAQTLREIGCEITDARSTDEAMRFLAHQSFDLIVSDVGRPEARDAGVALLEALAQGGNRTPFAFYSTRRALARHAERIDHDRVAVATDSFVELLKAVKRLKTERDR